MIAYRYCHRYAMTMLMKIRMAKEIKKSFKIICVYKGYFCYHYAEFFDVLHKAATKTD